MNPAALLPSISDSVTLTINEALGLAPALQSVAAAAVVCPVKAEPEVNDVPEVWPDVSSHSTV